MQRIAVDRSIVISLFGEASEAPVVTMLPFAGCPFL
jgi:hypothetical protein